MLKRTIGCTGTDNFATCADVVRIGALCAEQWVPLFDALGVDLVISHHGIGVSLPAPAHPLLDCQLAIWLSDCNYQMN